MKFTRVYNTTIENSTDLSNGAFRAYVTLKSFCFGDKVQCYPCQTTLAKKIGVSTRQLQRYIAELVSKQYISIKKNASILKTNLYTLLKESINNTIDSIQKAIKEPEKDSKKDYIPYKKKSKSSFCDFEQRDYDFGELERQLLGR